MKNIAFFVTGIDSGGIENYLLRFIKFSNNKLNATVYCKSGEFGDLKQEYITAGAELKPFKLGMFSILDYTHLHAELKKQDYDAIVDFTGNFAAIPLLIAKTVGINNRISFYRGSTNHFKEDFFRLTYNGFLNQLIPIISTSILSNSKSALNFFFKDKWQNNPKYEVIYNGIDAQQFLSTDENLRKELNIPENAFVIGHVGRYNVAKNHKTIIEVAIQMCKQDSNVYFVLCGKDTDVFLRDYVVSEGLDKQILLLGLRNDVIAVLNTLDCFYFPSLTEGQPNALIEAMVVGLPFVASDIEPNKETVPKLFHTQLIPPNDIEKAVDKINEIKNNSKLRDELNLKTWTIAQYNPDLLFNKFFEKL